MDRDRELDAEEDSTPPSKTGLILAQLKIVGRYALLAAPAVSVAALVVSVIAMKNSQSQSDRTKLVELTAKVDSLNASLSDTKGELDTLKLAMAHEKSVHAEERKKGDMRDEKIIQSVTRLQVKLKIAPTLETQLREAASAPVAAPAVSAASAPVAAPASATTAKKVVAATPVPKAAGEKPVVVKPKPGVAGKNTSTVKPGSRTKSSDKESAQVKAMRDAINKFNQQ